MDELLLRMGSLSDILEVMRKSVGEKPASDIALVHTPVTGQGGRDVRRPGCEGSGVGLERHVRNFT